MNNAILGHPAFIILGNVLMASLVYCSGYIAGRASKVT